MIGDSENRWKVLFGDETKLYTCEVPTRIWDLNGSPTRIKEDHSNGGIAMFVFVDGAGTEFHYQGHIGRSDYTRVSDQLEEFIKNVDEVYGHDSGFLIVIDNATWHQKALPEITKRWSYLPPNSLTDAEMEQ